MHYYYIIPFPLTLALWATIILVTTYYCHLLTSTCLFVGGKNMHICEYHFIVSNRSHSIQYEKILLQMHSIVNTYLLDIPHCGHVIRKWISIFFILSTSSEMVSFIHFPFVLRPIFESRVKRKYHHFDHFYPLANNIQLS